MGPLHAEIGSLCGTGHDYTEGSIYNPIHVWLLTLSWIGWSWMVRPIHDSTSQIDIKIGPSHKAGEERSKLGGAAELLFRAMSAHNRAGNQKGTVVEYV